MFQPADLILELRIRCFYIWNKTEVDDVVAGYALQGLNEIRVNPDRSLRADDNLTHPECGIDGLPTIRSRAAHQDMRWEQRRDLHGTAPLFPYFASDMRRKNNISLIDEVCCGQGIGPRLERNKEPS